MHPTLANRFLFNAGIGLLTFSRSVLESCVWRTDFCTQYCYTKKEYRLYGQAIISADAKNEVAWTENNCLALKKRLDNPSQLIRRVRMFSRGEGFKDYADIQRAANILQACPNTLFWWPTRAWRNPLLRLMIQNLRAKFPNLRVLASTDPTTTPDEYETLIRDGWNTMFFGSSTPPIPGMFSCPKTHKNPATKMLAKGYCAFCKAGCFAAKQVHVHLKQH